MNLIAFSRSRNCVNTQYAALSGAMHVMTFPGQATIDEVRESDTRSVAGELFTGPHQSLQEMSDGLTGNTVKTVL